MKLCDINTIYINLDKRPDRRIHVENELKKINIGNVTRFKGVEMKNGAIGCSMSHMKCVELAKNNSSKKPLAFLLEKKPQFQLRDYQ